ncbi:hypothetical protein T492DRAFT_1038562 [Pavlovales sp. CCMP2436]|nr:hypothetical protein T492DRAFT_1038562 [Pavlovales sp. CCMP2436]
MTSRPVHEVFGKSAPAPQGMLAERFGSTGKSSKEHEHEHEGLPGGLRTGQLEAGGLRSGRVEQKLEVGMTVKVIGRYGKGSLVENVEGSSWQIMFEDGVEAIVLADRIVTDLTEASVEPKADNRTLFERLKEQKDAKQDAFDHNNTFKNQMDHWRLDDDDAAFESDRAERNRADADKQRAEADEDLLRYKAAMAVKTRKLQPDAVAMLLPLPMAAPPPPEPKEQAGAKRKAAPIGLKVKPVVKKGTASQVLPAAAAGLSTAPRTAAPCLLPGMGEYDDSDSDQ